MYQEFYTGNPLLGFPVFALILFMALFAGGAAYAWKRRPHDDDSMLPFKDEDSHV